MRHILFTCLTLLLAFSATAEPSSEALPALDYDAFRTLPILHEGRVKPLDTVARVSLQSIYGKQRLQGQDAIAWLAELLFSPEKAFERPVFNIPNPDVIHGLNLEANPEHHYAYTALSLPLLKNLGTLRPLLTIPEKDLTLAQQQLVMLYSQMQLFGQLGASMTSTLPIFTLEAPLAEKLDLPADVPLPHMQLQKKRDTPAEAGARSRPETRGG
ncbi:MAG: hypothetical protein H6908_03615 [Hyphomicrobiales bacterium]|nr:hypothetical protein [Hyphomicrobiales bacterium]